MNIISEIREGLKLPGASKSGLAEALGRQPSVVTAILGEGKNGKPRQVKADEIEKIRAYFRGLVSDPAAGTGTFLTASEAVKPQPTVIRPSGPEPSEVVKVGEGWPDVGDEWMDVRGVTVGGDDSFFYFGDVIDQVRRPPGIRNAKNVAALNVAGESMAPRFKSGELIYVQQRLPAPGDDVVVELYPENEGDAPKAFLKEMTRRTGRRIYCKQHNPPSDIEFDAGEVKTVWRVLTMRDLLG